MSQLPDDQQEDLMFFLQQIERLEKDFKQLRSEHMKTGAQDNERLRKAKEAEMLFKDSIKACERDIMKAHETGAVKEENGSSYEKVSNSYFFEIKRKKFLQENPTSQLVESPQVVGSSLNNGQSLDRHSKDVIYKTIKHILFNAKEDKKRAHIMSVQIDWEEFRRFSPMQIMGLLLLRDDALDKMDEVLFAKNRGKLIGGGMTPNPGNVTSMLPPVSPASKKY